MRNKIKYCLLFVLTVLMISVLLFGCNKSNPVVSTNPVDTDTNYLPMAVGNYWIYTSYQTEAYYGGIINGTKATDSIVIVSQENYLGMSAFKFIQFTDGKAVDTIFIYSTAGRFYQAFNSLDSIPMLQDRWLLFANFSGPKSWHIFDSTIDNINYNFLDTNRQAMMDLAINGEITNSWEGKTVDSIFTKFKAVNFKNDNRIYFPHKFWFVKNGDNLFDSVQVNRTILRNVNFIYARNIGIIQKRIVEPEERIFTVPSTIRYGIKLFKYNGRQSDLIRFKINK